jgi:hypothetical protein
MAGSDLAALMEGVISLKKQQGNFSLDLTVKSISKVLQGGSLDFGGSEFQPAALESLPPVKQSPDDDYGWWNLAPGLYMLTVNERLSESGKGLALIVPHERVLQAGAVMVCAAVEALDVELKIPLHVGSAHLGIKENARVAKALLFLGTD